MYNRLNYSKKSVLKNLIKKKFQIDYVLCIIHIPKKNLQIKREKLPKKKTKHV